MTRRAPLRHRRAAAPSPPAAAVRTRWPAIRAAVAILAVALVSYGNALHGPFVFDDRSAIEENLSIRNPADLVATLRPPPQTPVSGRPLVNLTFALNYAFGGLRVEGYHATNIALHLLAALILLGILRRTFARTSLLQDAPMAGDGLALIATLLWTAHPLNSEAVDYVTQRSELMMGLLFLLALYGAIRAVDGGRGWIAVTAISGMLAAAAKESAIMLPFVIGLWDRTFAFATLRAAWRRRALIYASAAISWLVFGALASQASATRSLTGAGDGSRWTYLLHQAAIVPRYLRLSLWPHGLIFDYGEMSPISLVAVWPGVLLLLVLFVLTLVALFRRSPFGFWAAWVWLTLAPASSVIPIVTEVGAERRMYLPLAGVTCLIVLGAAFASRRFARDGTVTRRVAWAVGGTAVFALSAATIVRNADYRSGLTLWQTVVDRRPGPRARKHLSVYLRDAGRTDESITHLRLAVAGDEGARHALAAALLERGDVAEALTEFEVFLRTRPHDRDTALARREYAGALLRAGRRAEAISQLRTAVRDEPGNIRNYVELADAERDAGHLDEAIRVYEDAERLEPGNVVVLANLGDLLAERGRTGDAIARLRAAIAIDPGLTAPRLQLVQMLLVDQAFGEAEAEARRLVSALPSSADAHNLLGVALASQNRLGAAREAFAAALALDPSHAEARRNLARVDATSPAQRAAPPR